MFRRLDQIAPKRKGTVELQRRKIVDFHMIIFMKSGVYVLNNDQWSLHNFRYTRNHYRAQIRQWKQSQKISTGMVKVVFDDTK